MKAGWRTTEFWLTVAANLVSLLFASGIVSSGGTMDRVLGLVAMVLASLGYSISRGMAKKQISSP